MRIHSASADAIFTDALCNKTVAERKVASLLF